MACFQNVGLPSHLCCIKQTWHWWDRSRLVPHQLPLHHWLDKILRLELGMPPCSSPPAQGSSCQSCWRRSSCQLHHASIEPQVRHRHLVLGEGKGSHANAHSLAPQPVTAVDSLVPLPVKSFKHILQNPGAATENSVEPFKPLQICMTSMLSKHNCPKCEVCPFPSCGLDPNFHLS